MTKLPWRGKESKSSHEVFTATKPGECISVDHMISTHVGFFAQLKGKLTSKWYRAASIFIDHFSRLQFVHLMQDLLSDETIKAKETFEQFAAEQGVKIKHYHCNNGCFCEQLLPTSMPTKLATHFLWGQCTLPKWNCGACHPGPLGECPKTTLARSPIMASSSTHSSMAIRATQCSADE
jgi:hypothetical protein